MKFSSLICLIDSVVNMNSIDPDVWMVCFVDGKGEYILFDFDFVFRRILEFGVVEEPVRVRKH